jgi:hypothetical protein
MANVDKFPEQEAYARLIERGVRLLAMGLIVMGAVIISMGIWADNLSVATVGMSGVIGGVFWRLWLTIPDS